MNMALLEHNHYSATESIILASVMFTVCSFGTTLYRLLIEHPGPLIILLTYFLLSVISLFTQNSSSYQ